MFTKVGQESFAVDGLKRACRLLAVCADGRIVEERHILKFFRLKVLPPPAMGTLTL